MAKVALIVGSVRRDRQGIKVARWIKEKLENRNHIVFFIDPLELNLPLLDRMYKEMENPSDKLKDLRNKIKDAEGYLSITPEYNHGTSAAMKNTLDYFLEEYYFKPSAIVSYSPRQFWWRECGTTPPPYICRLGAPSISSSFPISRVQDVFDESGKLMDERYDKRVIRFLDEFEWYIEAFKNQRAKGYPY